MKKVLALIVAFALCFTVFAGCFATSAAPVTGYAFDITAAADDLTSDGGDVVVTVSGKYTTIDTAQYLVVTLPANVEFVSVAGGEDISEVDNPTEETVILYAFDEAANQIKFLEACEPDVDFAIEITVNVPAYSEEATNEYVIEANAQVAAFDAASSEDITTIEDSVTITVPAPVPEHTCTYGELQYKVEDGNCITYQECTDETCEEADKIVATVANQELEEALVLGSGLATRFRVLKTNLGEYNNNSVYAVVSHDEYNHNEPTTTEVIGTTDPVILSAKTSGSGAKAKFQFQYEGLAAKEMLSVVHVDVYSTDANDNVVLVISQDVFTIANYLKREYVNNVSASAAYKTLAADMLRYGAEAQKAMGYRASILPTEGVDPSLFSELPSTFANTEATNSTSVIVEPATLIQNTVIFRFRVAKNLTDSLATTADAFSYTIEYKNSSGETKTWPETEEDYAQAIVGENSNGKKWQFDFSKMPVVSINDYMTVRFYHGETEIAQYKYSFQAYAASAVANPSNPYGVLSQAICAYSSSAKVAFSS